MNSLRIASEAGKSFRNENVLVSKFISISCDLRVIFKWQFYLINRDGWCR